LGAFNRIYRKVLRFETAFFRGRLSRYFQQVIENKGDGLIPRKLLKKELGKIFRINRRLGYLAIGKQTIGISCSNIAVRS
jgi:hypothetical protein